MLACCGVAARKPAQSRFHLAVVDKDTDCHGHVASMNEVVHRWYELPSLGSIQAVLDDETAGRNVRFVACRNVHPVVAGRSGIDGAFPRKRSLNFSSRYARLGDAIGMLGVGFFLSLSEIEAKKREKK